MYYYCMEHIQYIFHLYTFYPHHIDFKSSVVQFPHLLFAKHVYQQGTYCLPYILQLSPQWYLLQWRWWCLLQWWWWLWCLLQHICYLYTVYQHHIDHQYRSFHIYYLPNMFGVQGTFFLPYILQLAP